LRDGSVQAPCFKPSGNILKRPYNFSPGPAALPQEVLEQAAAEMLDWHGSGMSVMEMSHRGAHFTSIYEQAQADLRELLAIPADYSVLFMQGGAIAENAIVPLNLIGKTGKADYVINGWWSVKSAREAAKYGDVKVVANSEDATQTQGKFRTIPPVDTWAVRSDAAYLHICGNETLDGIEFQQWPKFNNGVPLVVDASSHILSRPLDVNQFGVLYGGAQKNIGPSGLTIVIIRNDLLGHALPVCPSAFDYKLVADNQSMFNTPPTFAIYVAGLVFQWLKKKGGVAAMEQVNIAKAKLLYDCIDASSLYVNHVDKSVRSRMNVTFYLRDESLNQAFIDGAKDAGLLNIKGHKAVGGMRASIYNATPLAGVQALVAFMRDFEKRRG
jgi:phosphoserine aminotransferase